MPKESQPLSSHNHEEDNARRGGFEGFANLDNNPAENLAEDVVESSVESFEQAHNESAAEKFSRAQEALSQIESLVPEGEEREHQVDTEVRRYLDDALEYCGDSADCLEETGAINLATVEVAKDGDQLETSSGLVKVAHDERFQGSFINALRDAENAEVHVEEVTREIDQVEAGERLDAARLWVEEHTEQITVENQSGLLTESRLIIKDDEAIPGEIASEIIQVEYEERGAEKFKSNDDIDKIIAAADCIRPEAAKPLLEAGKADRLIEYKDKLLDMRETIEGLYEEGNLKDKLNVLTNRDMLPVVIETCPELLDNELAYFTREFRDLGSSWRDKDELKIRCDEALIDILGRDEDEINDRVIEFAKLAISDQPKFEERVFASGELDMKSPQEIEMITRGRQRLLEISRGNNEDAERMLRNAKLPRYAKKAIKESAPDIRTFTWTLEHSAAFREDGDMKDFIVEHIKDSIGDERETLNATYVQSLDVVHRALDGGSLDMPEFLQDAVLTGAFDCTVASKYDQNINMADKIEEIGARAEIFRSKNVQALFDQEGELGTLVMKEMFNYISDINSDNNDVRARLNTLGSKESLAIMNEDIDQHGKGILIPYMINTGNNVVDIQGRVNAITEKGVMDLIKFTGPLMDSYHPIAHYLTRPDVDIKDINARMDILRNEENLGLIRRYGRLDNTSARLAAMYIVNPENDPDKVNERLDILKTEDILEAIDEGTGIFVSQEPIPLPEGLFAKYVIYSNDSIDKVRERLSVIKSGKARSLFNRDGPLGERFNRFARYLTDSDISTDDVLSRIDFLQNDNDLAEILRDDGLLDRLGIRSSLQGYLAESLDDMNEVKVKIDTLTSDEVVGLIDENGPLGSVKYSVADIILHTKGSPSELTQQVKNLATHSARWKQLSDLTVLRFGEIYEGAIGHGYKVDSIPIAMPMADRSHYIEEDYDADLSVESIHGSVSIERDSTLYKNLSEMSKEELLMHMSEHIADGVMASGEVRFNDLNKNTRETSFRIRLFEAETKSRNENFRQARDIRNRQEVIGGVGIFKNGDVAHALDDLKALKSTLFDGSYCGEVINHYDDEYPFHVDTLQINDDTLSQDSFADRLYALNNEGYGKFVLVFDRSEGCTDYGRESRGKYSDNHRLIFGAVPSTEIRGIIMREATEEMQREAKNAIVENGMYIPIYNNEGSLILTPEEFDKSVEDGNYLKVKPRVVESSFERRGTQEGSNEGAWYTIPRQDGSGIDHAYVKFGDASEDKAHHLWTEYLADRLYAAVVPELVPKTEIVIINGRLARASYKVENIVEGEVTDEARNQGAVMDWFLGNWDAVYNSANLIPTEDGRAMRIDNGNALNRRARGEMKSKDAFGEEVKEAYHIDEDNRGGDNKNRDDNNENLGGGMRQKYPGLEEKDIQKQVAQLKWKLDDDTIRRLVDETRLPAKTRETLTNTLIARRNDLVKRFLGEEG